MEYCDLLWIDKNQSKEIIGSGISDERFVEMLNFLWHIDEGKLFSNIDRQHLLPIVSNIDKRKYGYGEYI